MMQRMLEKRMENEAFFMFGFRSFSEICGKTVLTRRGKRSDLRSGGSEMGVIFEYLCFEGGDIILEMKLS